MIVVAAILLCGCRIGEHIAEAPLDAEPPGPDGAPPDAGPPDAARPGLHAIIGERPEWTGTCASLDDRAEMEDRFDPPVRSQDMVAGWEFDTAADDYDDATYGFDPAWPGSESGRFSLRLRGDLTIAGPHCFSIDVGATGTDIIGGKNMCGQIWLGDAVAETGYESSNTPVVCADATQLDIVFWYFNIFEQAQLTIRHCVGEACTPDQPLLATEVTPR
jgi:hypothetical protein